MRRYTTTCLLTIGLSMAVSMALLVDSAAAIVLVNDTWKDGTDDDPSSTAVPAYAENNGISGSDADADGDLESAWFQSGDGSLNPVGANGPLRMAFTDATITSSASWTTYFTPEATPVNLAAAGDGIKVTWNFALTNVNASNTSQNFRIALAQTPDGSRVSANGSLPDAGYTGYAILGNMGQTLGNGNPFQLRRRAVASGNLLATSGNYVALANGATNGSDGYDAATPYTFTWEITRNASDGLDHIIRMSGGTLDNDGLAEVVFTDTMPIVAGQNFGSFAYNTFQVRPSGATTTAQIFDTSLFKVEFITATPPILAGDYNNNQVVDAADYAVWRDNNGTTNTLPNDPIGGTIGTAQYNQWKANFGKTPGMGAGSVLGVGAVPEPGTILLALAAATSALCVRRRLSTAS